MMRWDPFGDAMSLRQVLDRLLEEAVIRPSPVLPGSGERRHPIPLDLREHHDALVVTASLPGVHPDDVHITVQDDVLTIEAELRPEPEPAAGQPAASPQPGQPRYHYRERHYGRFFRQVQLPVPVNTEQAAAQFEHGVLTLRLPKAEAVRPRRIPITGSAPAQPLPTGAADTTKEQ